LFVFSDTVDFRTAERDDGLFNVGAMATGWFLWDMEWSGKNAEMHFVDINSFAKLGNLKTP